jgi:alkanesulfonate monooxygenase SsuD/methylene tetrahydromethanopterin reductase-like flavin-dependent oxidoreductase (luciferase family)
MRLGVFAEGYAPTGTAAEERLRQLVEQAVLADQVGLHSFSLSEQHFKFPTNSTSQPDLMLAAIARETSNIRLGLEVVVLPLHHPLHVAERVATLDVISDGRVDFGIGRGNTAATADAFGVAMEDSEARSVETLEVVLKCWAGGKVAHTGKYYRFGPVAVVPTPTQSPRPPVFWAAVSPGSHERGGSYGYDLLTGGNAIDWGQLQRRIDRYIEGWERENPGTPYGTVRVNVHGWCAESSQAAEEAYKPYVVEYVNRTVVQYKTAVQRSGRTVDFSASERFIDRYDMVREHMPTAIGDPQLCIAQLRRLAEMGVDEVTFRLDGPPHAEMLRCIRLLGEEVAPAVAGIGRAARRKPEVAEHAVS